MFEKILIVDDEKNIVRMLDYNLKKEGYQTILAYDGKDALKKIYEQKPDLIILDLMLPLLDGFEVCKILKKDQNTSYIPIIMLTAKNEEVDKLLGFELGADDYITKPFSVKELIARIKAIFRRVQKEEISKVVKFNDLTIDFEKIQVYIKDKPIQLTSKEFELLKILIEAKGKVLSRNYLLKKIWKYGKATELKTRTIDVHIRTLRKKLKNHAYRIITAKNYGYRFAVD
ncbi:MAG: response regulator transcription factor [Candidatus Omnitrophica bacterium]|nr:response regulator transcription factor [Candidatus Omnitrophota bacterium]